MESSIDNTPLVSVDAANAFTNPDISDVDTSSIGSKPVFDNMDGQSNTFGVFQVLVNTAIGSGALLLPYCLLSGLVTSLMISVLFAFVTMVTHFMLIETAYFTRCHDYKTLFIHSFGKKFVPFLYLINFLICFGASMIYCHWNGTFICQLLNLKDIPVVSKSIFWIFLSTMVIIFPIHLFREIKKLEKFAMIAFAMIILLIVHAAYYFVIHVIDDGIDPQHQYKSFDFKNPALISALSINSMSYNCILNLTPALEHLKNCTVNRAKKVSVLTVSVAFFLYNTLAIITYLTLYHDLDSGKSALECYEHHIFTDIAKAGVVLILIISSPLVLWTARFYLNQLIFKDQPKKTWIWFLVSFSICVGCAGIASISDDVLIFFNIVGGLFSPTIIFVLPTMFFLLKRPKKTIFLKILSGFVLLIALGTTVLCTYQAITDMLK